MRVFIDKTVSVLLSSSGSAIRARVRASDAETVERLLVAVRDDAAATVDSISATSAIRVAGQGAEGTLEIEAVDPISRRKMRQVAAQNERSMRRIGYSLDRQVVAAGGQVVTVYVRQRRSKA